MNKKSLIALILILIVSVFLFYVENISADEYNNSTLGVSVYVREPFARVQINPSLIDLGEITKGYTTNFTNVTFTNKGDFDIKITPYLFSNQNQIFNSLEFNTASCSTTSSSGWYNLTEWNGLTVDRPSEYNGTRSDYACVRLNLKNYEDYISGDLDLTEQITFLVMPN